MSENISSDLDPIVEEMKNETPKQRDKRIKKSNYVQALYDSKKRLRNPEDKEKLKKIKEKITLRRLTQNEVLKNYAKKRKEQHEDKLKKIRGLQGAARKIEEQLGFTIANKTCLRIHRTCSWL